MKSFEWTFSTMRTTATLELVTNRERDANRVAEDLAELFAAAAARFDSYRPDSEVNQMSRGELAEIDLSEEMQRVIDRCRLVTAMTDGAFQPRRPTGEWDLAGFIKGWALKQAGSLLTQAGFADWCLAAEGDVLANGRDLDGTWRVAISDPFNSEVPVAHVDLHDSAVATSGSGKSDTYIWTADGNTRTGIGSATVVGPCVDIADALATGSWALGQSAVGILNRVPEYHLLLIDEEGQYTSNGFPVESLVTS